MIRITTLVLISLVLASCTSTQRSSSLYAGGPGGLVFSFEDGTPPSIVQDAGQTPVELLVNVRNTGEYDTPYVRFMLTGINQNDFPGFNPGPHELEQIDGRALIQNQIVEGETLFLELGRMSYARELRSSSVDFTLHARACYPYATSATATVCLSDDYYKPDVSCDPSSASIASSSAPITIKNVQTSPVGANLLRLSFELEKNGPHRIWAPHDTQSCPNDRVLTVSEGDYVYVRIDGAGSGVSCTTLRTLDSGFDPSGILNARQQYRPDLSELTPNDYGYVRLTQGSARVQCTLTAPSGTDGRGTVDIVAAYYVEDSISKTFTVQRSGMTAGSTPPPPSIPPDVTDGSEHTGTSPTPSPTPTPTPTTPAPEETPPGPDPTGPFVDATQHYASRIHNDCLDFERRMEEGAPVTIISHYQARLDFTLQRYALCVQAGTNNLNECPTEGTALGPEQMQARTTLRSTIASVYNPSSDTYYGLCMSWV